MTSLLAAMLPAFQLALKGLHCSLAPPFQLGTATACDRTLPAAADSSTMQARPRRAPAVWVKRTWSPRAKPAEEATAVDSGEAVNCAAAVVTRVRGSPDEYMMVRMSVPALAALSMRMG